MIDLQWIHDDQHSLEIIRGDARTTIDPADMPAIAGVLAALWHGSLSHPLSPRLTEIAQAVADAWDPAK